MPPISPKIINSCRVFSKLTAVRMLKLLIIRTTSRYEWVGVRYSTGLYIRALVLQISHKPLTRERTGGLYVCVQSILDHRSAWHISACVTCPLSISRCLRCYTRRYERQDLESGENWCRMFCLSHRLATISSSTKYRRKQMSHQPTNSPSPLI